MPPTLLTEPEHREARQRAILELLRTATIESQGALVALLAERGIHATQSSVSRDFKELGVARVGGRYLAPAGGVDTGLTEISRFLYSVRPAGPHLAVLATTSGTAQMVGVALDRSGWPEIVGTVAGDDTVFVATAEAADQRRLFEHLAPFLAEKR